MTNYEKIKAMTKEEMAEFLEKVMCEFISEEYCEKQCEFRNKDDDCTYFKLKHCHYLDDKLVIAKWLEVKD